MPGSQTRGFDAVLELTEQSVNDVISTVFDSDGLLSSFLNGVGLGDADGAFSLDVSFGRPTDVPVPAGARDVLDMRFDIGEDGSLGQIRAVAGLAMDRTSSDAFDIAQVDFRNQLHFTGFTAGSFPVPLLPQLFADFLRERVGAIPVVPLPVERNATDPADLPTRGDLTLIDDTSQADRDALGVALTFAGGAAGDATALTNFVEPGDTGAIAIFFRWLARILRPRIAGALGASEDDFDVGDDFIRLNKTIPVSGGGETADLTELELSLADGFIELVGEISKSGFCYSATGRISGRIRVEVEDGDLVFQAEIDDPEVDVDVPWECYLVAVAVGVVSGGLLGVLVGTVVGAVGGAVVGGVVGGVVVGGIVGAILLGILVPVLLAIAENVVENTVKGVAGNLADRLEQDLRVPAIGLQLVFQRVFIDDVAIQFDARPIETVPIRSSGVLDVRDGQGIDLDNGQVGRPSDASVDLEWLGQGHGRRLRTRCGARLARLGSTDLGAVLRWRLYPLAYGDAAVPLSELAVPVPFPAMFGTFLPDSLAYLETRLVYAVKTAEGRYSVVQVVEVRDDGIRLRYRTYEKPMPSVRLRGEFACDVRRVPEVVKDLAGVRFDPVPRKVPSLLAGKDARPAAGGRLGRWKGVSVGRRSRTGHFRAAPQHISGKPTFRWRVAGTDLTDEEGSVDVGGEAAAYSVNGDHLALTLKGAREVEVLVEVRVTDEAGDVVSASICARFERECRQEVDVIPPLPLQVEVFHQRFSVVRLPSADLRHT